ncbi:MAG: hypothetical protein QXK89_08480 [Candidatus Bathyarchaeia archaeon]
MSGENEKAGSPKALYMMSISYFVAGVVLLVAMTQTKYMPPHLGLIGVLNMVASYSITRMKRRSLYTIFFVSLISIIFSLISLATILSLFSSDTVSMLILLGMIAYTLLSISLLLYAILNRNKFL